MFGETEVFNKTQQEQQLMPQQDQIRKKIMMYTERNHIEYRQKCSLIYF